MQTKSAKPGKTTLGVEVANVSGRGFWLRLAGRDRFMAFKEFPWFRKASRRQLSEVRLQGPGHLYWPGLDIDLAVESIEHPERFPLVSGAAPRAKGNGRRR
jgi:hypothetical protein